MQERKEAEADLVDEVTQLALKAADEHLEARSGGAWSKFKGLFQSRTKPRREHGEVRQCWRRLPNAH